MDGITDDGHEFEQALAVGDGQGSLVCCSPWGHGELDTTETELTEFGQQRPIFLRAVLHE